MRKRVFGQAVTATDVERLSPDTGPTDFVRLCGALIGRALADRVGSFTLPEISERINVPDAGVDAEYTTPNALSVPETGGLIGPGRTIFQFKYRDVSASNRSAIVQRLAQKLRLEFPRVAPKCDRYVLLTNVQLSGAQPSKLRDALIERVPPFAGKHIVIWGAAEIALALNQVPYLRHLFFSEGGLCTLDFAEEELKAAYSKIGWPPFINREQERAAIDVFINDETTRVLHVTGPRGVGKTRLLIEALRSHGTLVLWASSPDNVTLDLLRELDSADTRAILVVDRCDGDSISDLDEFARSREGLKTIVIRTRFDRREIARQEEILPIEPLGNQDARKLLAAVVRSLPFAQESWLIEKAGGLPGLILQFGALLTEARNSISTVPEHIENALGSLLERQYLQALDPDTLHALEVASVLQVLGIEGEVEREIDAVCHALDVPLGVVKIHLQTLEQIGLVRRRGRFVEVAPPLLAEHLASRQLTNARAILVRLQLNLEPGAFLRFLERLRSVRSAPVRDAIASLFSSGGWFDDFNALSRNAKSLEILAPAAPIPALRCVERILGTLSLDELNTLVADDVRRPLVWTLEDLALRSETFEGAAAQLLALAEAENETLANSATGVFLSLFHWQHPEVTVSLSRRYGVLRKGAEAQSAVRRKIAATACAEAFKEHTVFSLHHPKGPALPERPYRPQTWGEVRRYGSEILDLLIKLSKDSNPEVEQAAVSAFLDVFRPFTELSLTPDGLDELGLKAFGTISRIGRSSETARRRADVITAIELTLKTLSESRDLQEPAAAKDAIERAHNLLKELTSASLRDRLWRWVGPKSWGLSRHLDDSDEEAIATRSVASELLASSLLFAEHLDWLTGEEAERRDPLFRVLGEEAKDGDVFGLLLTRSERRFWPQAFSAYVQGWHTKDSGSAERMLDDILESHPDLAAGVLAATCSLPSSSKTVDRLLRLLAKGSMPRSALAGQIAFSLQWDQLESDDAEKLISALDDGTPEIRSSLLFPFLIRMLRGADMTSALRSLAWRFLDSTSPIDNNIRRHDWDGLAAKLGRQEPVRLLDLVEGVVRKSLAEPDRRFNLDHELPRVWRTLEERNRDGLLQMLLRLAMTPELPYWIDWMLLKLIDPSRDREALLKFARKAGIEGARVVALNLEAHKPGFWDLARDLIADWGDDDQIKERLANHLFGGGWKGSAVPMISSRIEGAKKLLADSDPRVAQWAQEVVSGLEDWHRHEEREDKEEWIWDYRIRRTELEGMLQQKDSPERLWAISRLLKDAPPKRVLELLTLEEILDALPKIHDLDEQTRRTWNAYTQFWSQPH